MIVKAIQIAELIGDRIDLQTSGWMTYNGAKDTMQELHRLYPTVKYITMYGEYNNLLVGWVRA